MVLIFLGKFLQPVNRYSWIRRTVALSLYYQAQCLDWLNGK